MLQPSISTFKILWFGQKYFAVNAFFFTKKCSDVNQCNAGPLDRVDLLEQRDPEQAAAAADRDGGLGGQQVHIGRFLKK